MGVCDHCSSNYVPTRNNQKYCSKQCYLEASKEIRKEYHVKWQRSIVKETKKKYMSGTKKNTTKQR